MLRSLFRILRASFVQIDTEMAEKYAKHYPQQQPAVCGKFAFVRYAAVCVSALMGLVTLTFDLELERESLLKWGTFLPNLGTLGFFVLELFAMYATYGQTDGRTKATLIVPFPTLGGIIYD